MVVDLRGPNSELPDKLRLESRAACLAFLSVPRMLYGPEVVAENWSARTMVSSKASQNKRRHLIENKRDAHIVVQYEG